MVSILINNEIECAENDILALCGKKVGILRFDLTRV